MIFHSCTKCLTTHSEHWSGREQSRNLFANTDDKFSHWLQNRNLLSPPPQPSRTTTTHMLSVEWGNNHSFLPTLLHCSHTFYKDDPMCRICATEPETVIHLLSRCPALLGLPILFNLQASSSSLLPTSDEDVARLLLGINPFNTKHAHMTSTACHTQTPRHHSLIKPSVYSHSQSHHIFSCALECHAT